VNNSQAVPFLQLINSDIVLLQFLNIVDRLAQHTDIKENEIKGFFFICSEHLYLNAKDGFQNRN